MSRGRSESINTLLPHDMKPRNLFSLGILLLFVLTGCRSYGPRFDIRQPGAGAAEPGGTNLVEMPDSDFTWLNPTNEIRSEWLQRPTNFFRFGPSDTFEIEMLGESASRSVVGVGPDGKIYYSLLPGLSVWGLTLTEAKTLLENELTKFIRVKPEITLTLRTVGSKRAWILGSVESPGVYTLATPMTLVEMITMAGGVSQAPGAISGMPDLQNSFLLRKGEVVRVDFHRLLSTGDLSQNIYVEPEDLIYLHSSNVRNIYVIGAVASPNVVTYSEHVSLGSAIASAGGPLEYAQVSQVVIVRGSLKSPKVAMVNYREIYKGKAPDVKVQPGDIVYVPFVPYRRLAQFLEGAIRQFAYSIASQEGYRAAGSTVGSPTIGGSAPAR